MPVKSVSLHSRLNPKSPCFPLPDSRGSDALEQLQRCLKPLYGCHNSIFTPHHPSHDRQGVEYKELYGYSVLQIFH